MLAQLKTIVLLLKKQKNWPLDLSAFVGSITGSKWLERTFF
jgi:hypothetical protein